MKMKIVTASFVLLSILMLTAATQAADVVYCDHIGVPKGCVARDGVALKPAPGVGAPARTVRVPQGSSAARVYVPPYNSEYVSPYNQNPLTAYPYDQAKGNIWR
jgi:hypothetical protein